MSNNSAETNTHGGQARAKLVALQAEMKSFSPAQAFAQDSKRAEQFSLEAAGLFIDYSKHLLDETSLNLLLALADECQLEQAVAKLFAGEMVNNTEKRAALHTLLRSQAEDISQPSLQPLHQEVIETKQRMSQLSAKLNAKQLLGSTGKPIRYIVNIGIGGSDLGPDMIYKSLQDFHLADIQCHFVSNVDACHLDSKLELIKPEETIFIVSSKSFTTIETLANAKLAKAWLQQEIGDQFDSTKHFLAVSSKPELAIEFGIAAENVYPMWDWVGGRYSSWSAIGLVLALGLSYDNFEALLAGARDMDLHFRDSKAEGNMPVILGLLSVWYSEFWHCQSQSIAPYSQAMRDFPAFLQQLSMESNGKSVTRQGQPSTIVSSPVIWGAAGSNGQHSFFQLLHQGKQFIPVDFILPLKTPHSPESHQLLAANCFAQSQAMMTGRSLASAEAELRAQGHSEADIADLAKHKVMSGNRPSTTILMPSLDPKSLGALIALYEHKTYVESILWDINAFDQWGVELGKELCAVILPALTDKQDTQSFDPSTRALIDRYNRT